MKKIISRGAQLGAMLAGGLVAATMFVALAVVPGVAEAQTPSCVGNFYYTGATQACVVPAGMTVLHMQLWGAGGGGGLTHEVKSPNTYYPNNKGGNGGYTDAYMAVTPGQVFGIMVGQGGVCTGAARTYGGGGAARATIPPNPNDHHTGGTGASGGGRSAMFFDVNEMVTAGGGGGGGCDMGVGQGGHGGGIVGEDGRRGRFGGFANPDGDADSNLPREGYGGAGLGGSLYTGGGGAELPYPCVSGHASNNCTIFPGLAGSFQQGGDAGYTVINNAVRDSGGAGGGGYYGGGGGSGYDTHNNSGGGGASSDDGGGGGGGTGFCPGWMLYCAMYVGWGAGGGGFESANLPPPTGYNGLTPGGNGVIALSDASPPPATVAAPTITGPTTGTTYTAVGFTLNGGASSDGALIRYIVDWDNDGGGDELPIPSGAFYAPAAVGAAKAWAGAGAHTFRVYSQNSNLILSPPTYHTITLTDPPPTVLLTVSSNTYTPGNPPVTIQWSSSWATSCTGTNVWTNGQTAGSGPVSPAATITYTVTCTGPGGTASDSKTVTVVHTVAAPTITGPVNGISGSSQVFTLNGGASTDGAPIRYIVDWNNDGGGDELPVPSGAFYAPTAIGAAKTWPTAGSYTFRVYSQNSNLLLSPPAFHTINIATIVAPPTITGPTTGAPGVTHGFTLNGGASSDGAPIRYILDWDNDGGGDELAVPSGAFYAPTTVGAARAWPTVGAKTFRVYSQNSNLLISSPAYHTITLAQPPATITANLTATPSRVRVNERTRISWQVTNASSCTVTGTNGDSWSTTSSASGGELSSPIVAPVTYTLTCIGLDGATVTQQAAVRVQPVIIEQ